MEFFIGTSSGVFLGESGMPAEGIEDRGIRHLGLIGGEVFAGAVDGVYRSSDHGRSWRRSGVEGCDVWDVIAAPGDSRTLYAGTQPAHMFRSRDGGDTWENFDSFLTAPGSDRWCLPGGQTA